MKATYIATFATMRGSYINTVLQHFQQTRRQSASVRSIEYTKALTNNLFD